MLCLPPTPAPPICLTNAYSFFRTQLRHHHLLQFLPNPVPPNVHPSDPFHPERPIYSFVFSSELLNP